MSEKDFDAAALFERRMLDTFGMDSEEYQDERARGPVSTAYLLNAIALVEKSGINTQIVEWENEARKSTAGRTRILPLTAILPIMLLHIQMGQGVVYGDIATTLHRRFKLKHFELLGIPNVSSDKTDWYHRFWRGLNRIISLIDPYPLPLNGKMEPGEYKARIERILKGDGKTQHQRNMKRIDWLCNQIVLTTANEMPAEFLERYKGNISIDASLVPIAGTPNPTNPELKKSNIDPFSERYRRGGSHKGKGAKTDKAGYEIETATMVWNRPYESLAFPSLVTAVGFHQPGRLIGAGMKLIDRHKCAYNLRRFLVIVDRAYNNSKVETFHIPARKAGVELVIKYRKPDLGLQGHYEDLILVDGNWHVRSMPEDLIYATADLVELKNKKSEMTAEKYQEEKQKLRARISNRTAYRMIAKGLPDADGYQRFSYPTGSPVPHAPLNGHAAITIPLMIPETIAPPRRPGGKSVDYNPSNTCKNLHTNWTNGSSTTVCEAWSKHPTLASKTPTMKTSATSTNAPAEGSHSNTSSAHSLSHRSTSAPSPRSC